ncbi:unnamed protein product [Gadus morhua 'NCC']
MTDIPHLYRPLGRWGQAAHAGAPIQQPSLLISLTETFLTGSVPPSSNDASWRVVSIPLCGPPPELLQRWRSRVTEVPFNSSVTLRWPSNAACQKQFHRASVERAKHKYRNICEALAGQLGSVGTQ